MAYRKTERVTAQLADKRARILSAARQLVSEGGFQEAPIAAVAALADVATGTVYRYFPSKTDLLNEVVDSASRRELEIIISIAASEGAPLQRLAAAARAFASRALRGRRLAYALIAEPVDAEIDATRLKYRRALGEVFEGIIEQGVEAGVFPPQNAAASAACVVGALNEGLVGPLSPESLTRHEEHGELVEEILAFCLRAVAGKPPAKVVRLR